MTTPPANNFVRMFIGCRIEITDRIQEVLDDFESGFAGFRVVPPRNMHVTVCFLGDLPAEAAAEFVDCLAQHLANVSAFDATISTPGGFPSTERASIAWLGAGPQSAFAELNAKCVEVADVVGVNTEDRPFHPHLTIARQPRPRRSRRRRTTSTGRADLREFAQRWSGEPISVQRIDTVTVYSSELAAGGSIYTPLREIPLRPENESPATDAPPAAQP